MKKLLTPVKVGVLAMLAVAGFFYAIHSVQQGSLGSSDTYRVYAMLDDVLGVAKRSRVVMAGIEVGYIESVELAGSKAKLNLRIDKDVSLYRDAALSKISESLLGDKLITLSSGHDKAHPLRDGGEIKNVIEEAGMTGVFRKLDDITGDIREVTLSLKNMLGGMERDDSLGGIMRRMNDIADNVAELTRQVNATLVRGSGKIEQILGDVAGVTSGTRERYKEILDDIQAVSADVRKLVASLNDIVGQGGEDWKESVGGVKETLQKANRSLENLDQITRKINEGQGTLGRLVNDDKVLDKAEGVLDDVSTFTSRLARLRTEIDLHTEFYMRDVRQNYIKNYLSLKLIPKSDKYYLIELIDDPLGSVDVVNTCTTKDDGSTTCEEETTTRHEFKFSVQFAKRYYWLGLRFGIIENTGGLGANLYFLDDDLEFKLDLFQFGKDYYGDTRTWPRLKALVVYRPTWLVSHVYLAAGGDDFFSINTNNDTFDYFFGAGLYFEDEDLKAIFTTIGTPGF